MIWKSDLSDKIKQDFFQAVTVFITVWMHYMNANKTHGEKARWELHKNVMCCFPQILCSTGYSLDDLPGGIDEERQSGKSAWFDYIYKYMEEVIVIGKVNGTGKPS